MASTESPTPNSNHEQAIRQRRQPADEEAESGGREELLIPESPTNDTADAPQDTTEDDEEKAKGGAGADNEAKAKVLPRGFVMTDLDKDIYSLIFTGNPMGPAFWFGMTVCFFQGAIVWLVFYDLIDWSSETNPMRIPAGNDLPVTIAQGALMILMSQDSMDLMEGLEFLIDGYHPEVLEICPHATFVKYLLAGTAHFIVGCLLAIVIFVLLMQETTVFGLGVDFVAMNKFFAQIDNIAFKIGARGVFSPQIRQEIKRVGQVKIRRNSEYTWARRFRDVLLIVGVMTGYGIFKARQLNGDYICDSIFVEVGDVFNPGIGEVSGMFDTLEGLQQYDGRVIYQERSTGQFRLAYCEKSKRWTMTPYLDGKFEPCGSPEVEVLAQSGVADSYDILTTENTWSVLSVRHGSGFNPFTHFSMRCNECSTKCKPENGVCDERENCVCNEGHYGLNCEYKDPCPNLMVNVRTELFPPFVENTEDHEVPYRFSILRQDNGDSIQVQYRPVYYNQTHEAAFLLAFSGRRWLLYGYPIEYGGREAYIDNLTDPSFNMIDTSFSPLYASSTMDYGTPSDGPIPDSVDWFYVARKYDGPPNYLGDDDTPISYRTSWWVEENQPLRTRLQCGFCSPDLNPCKNFGICQEEKGKPPLCLCYKEVGSLCEYEVKCTDTDFYNPMKAFGCPYNATCGRNGKCDCPDGFSGNTCQVTTLCAEGVSPFNDAPVSDCRNDGVCNTDTGVCTCPDPYFGPLCQFS